MAVAQQMLPQVAAQDIGQVTYIEPGPDPVVGIIDQSNGPGHRRPAVLPARED